MKDKGSFTASVRSFPLTQYKTRATEAGVTCKMICNRSIFKTWLTSGGKGVVNLCGALKVKKLIFHFIEKN